MSYFTTKVINEGRMTIPKHIREFYQLSEGDFVEVTILRVVKKGERVDE